MAPTEREHILVAVLFTDIVGSTELAGGMGDESCKRLLRKHHGIVSHLVKEHGGRVVDTAGDGVFAVFDRPASGSSALSRRSRRSARSVWTSGRGSISARPNGQAER
jgi:class 3 adenylate cyclase